MPSCFDMGEEDREEDFDRGIHEPRSTAMMRISMETRIESQASQSRRF